MAKENEVGAYALRKILGAVLKQRREQLGLSQTAVATHAEMPWVASIGQIESGKVAMASRHIFAMAEILQIDSRRLAEAWMYYYAPGAYLAVYGEDPYETEGISRPDPTAYAAPGRPPSSRARNRWW
ncbi:helix-turn-helix domain-containing protein [Xylophilus sp. GOD-11R]|uniref:helix-turn-helix domain-containing protein n=1 Tax=Xylophilus sp. GOD-11R TaxID=3089814 RepID=UPI00399BBDB2